MKRLIIVWLHMFVVLSFISVRPVSASNIISTFHDDFERQALGPDYFSDTNSSDSYYVIDNGILTINSGSQDGGGRWVKSNQSYAYSPGSNGLIFETRAKIGEGERHFAVGLIGDSNDGFFGFGDLHATHQLESSTTPASTGGLIQYIDQVDISEWHTYRIDVICSTAKYYVDGTLRSVDSNPNDIPFNKPLRIIFDKGSQGTPATLSVDYVDAKIVEDSCNQPPTANAGGLYTAFVGDSLTLDASASSDPDDDALTYEWDLDNDGVYNDATGITTTSSFIQVGDHTISLRVTDDGGLSATDTATVTVLPWTLEGFYQPVDMNGVYNIVKNGSTVPLKFEIFAGSTELTDIAYVKSLTYAQTSCNASATTDEIETTTTGSTSLRYDTTAGQFIYNWKTPSIAGKCYRVTLTTMAGSSLVAYFKLK